MYERFTDRSRRTMQLAQQEAMRFNHEWVGTEHMLLGLIKEGGGVAAEILRGMKIDLRAVRLEVEKLVQSGPDMEIMGKLPQTPRAKKVIEYAIEEARNLNQQAVWLACCGLGKVAHGASHGIGYLLGAVCGVPHGYTSCIMLPAVLHWNAEINGQRQSAIAEALGRKDGDAATAVRLLVRRLGLPGSLQEVGVKREQLEKIASLASRHPVVRRNPRPVTSPEHVMAMLQLAWEPLTE